MYCPLVSTQWLDRHLFYPNLFILNVSMENVIGKETIKYDKPLYIINAYKVNLETDLSDIHASTIHCFPKAMQLQKYAYKLGFNKKSTIIIYDDQGIYSSPRVWWILRSFGYKNVFILDGGLPKWLAEERATTNTAHLEPKYVKNMNNRLSLHKKSIVNAHQVQLNIHTENATLIDVRSAERFFALVPEPREGIRSGHIPKSKNLPFNLVLNGIQYQSIEGIKQQFKRLGVTYHSHLIFSCGSGITACIVLVAAILVGFKHIQLYDGSWTEWGGDKSLPIYE